MADIGWYNGWSPEQRLATLPIQKKAIASGGLLRPTVCSICRCTGSRNWRADDAVWLHDERYDRPLEAYAICRSCHRTLHQRFDNPISWTRLVEAHADDGAWFMRLSLDPASRYQPFDATYPDGLPLVSIR